MIQPFTQVVVVSPRVGGGDAGSEGGGTDVADAVGETGVIGAEAGDVGRVTLGSPSHATNAIARATVIRAEPIQRL